MSTIPSQVGANLDVQSAVSSDTALVSSAAKTQKGRDFWMTVVVLCASILLSAMDLTAVSTVLPTITKALNGGPNYVWVGTAYSLTSTAILPLNGSLADIFGRKPLMLISITIFALGSALAGAAPNMTVMIIARAIQGLGGGSVTSLCEIILCDLVPLAERGTYQGILAVIYSFACGIGPPVGGIFAERGSWRWLFYLNLPVCGVCLILSLLFLNLRTPEGSILGKLGRIDWLGNMIVIAGTTLVMIGLAQGGIQFPWSSPQVLAPLVIGLCLILTFIAYEAKVPCEPTIPWTVISSRTSSSAYLGVFFHGIACISPIYFLPVFFQASLVASPIRSGVDILATSMIASPFALVSGIVIQRMQKYRPVLFMGWALMIVGLGLLSLLKSGSSTGLWVGFQIIAAAGSGLLWVTFTFPILAPHSVTLSARALAFYSFLRTFAMTWGISISSTILQNELKRKLPQDFVSEFPAGIEIAYAAIPLIPTLDEPLKGQVREAFASSLSTVWLAMTAVAAMGFLSNLALKEVPLSVAVDKNFGLRDTPGQETLASGKEEGSTSPTDTRVLT